jgi:type I restriction enzyme S subunit
VKSDSWRKTTLGDETEILTGFPFKSAQYTDNTDDIRLLRGDNIVQGKLRWENVKRWKSSETESLDSYFLSDDDVVLAMDRPWIEAGLKYAKISKVDLPCLLVQRVSRIRGSESLDQKFLRYVIGSSAFTEYVLSIQTGTAVPHISSNQIKQFSFVCPPIEEQKDSPRFFRH